MPGFTQTIIDEIKKPSNSDKLKKLVLDQFKTYSALTHGDVVKAEDLKKILAEYNVGGVEAFNAAAEKKLSGIASKTRWDTFAVLISVLVFLSAWGFLRKSRDLHKTMFVLSVGFAFVLLLTGLSLPMIEIDARINRVDLFLVGEHVQFNDQVLYYRSKASWRWCGS